MHYTESQMSVGDDVKRSGAEVDHHNDPLPEHSAVSAKLDYESLFNSSKDWRLGGSRTWVNIFFFLVRRTLAFQFKNHQITGKNNLDRKRGDLCVAWHTNGMIDPALVLLHRGGRFVVAGRHDLVTRRSLRFWAKRFSVQPVLRQAELLRGGCTEDEAKTLNSRSLRRLSEGLSKGLSCALFPEGTSHSSSHLLRLRTGPSRVALVAKTLSEIDGTPLPRVLPIGLHYRVRHLHRTDLWVEIGKPFEIEEEGHSAAEKTEISKGSWVEPAADAVHSLQDKIRDNLAPLTPQAPDWSTYRAWQTIGHLLADHEGKRPKSWRDEVIAGRRIGNQLRNSDGQDPSAAEAGAELMSNARSISRTLRRQGLDARDLRVTKKQIRFKRSALHKAAVWTPVRLLFGLLFLPITLLSSGIQITFGFIQGNKTDEGQDARSSVQFLFAMFGSLAIWPILLILIFSVWWSLVAFSWVPPPPMLGSTWSDVILSLLLHASFLFFLFWFSGRATFIGIDAWIELRRSVWRRRMRRSHGEEILKRGLQIIELSEKLGLTTLESPNRQEVIEVQ